MSDRILRYWYRATCFGDPVAPWRDSLTEARRDLISMKLGSYDEWGAFFTTVPGGLLRDSAWVDYDEWAATRNAVSLAAARPATGPGRQSETRSRHQSRWANARG